MTLQRAVLEISGDIDNTSVDGEFHMVGNLTAGESVQPRFLLGNQLPNWNTTVQGILGNAGRRGLYKDQGAGLHTFEFEFKGWEGAVDKDGNNVPWGDTTKNAPSVYNATGADPITQIQVLNNYIRWINIDSFQPAKLRIGEYDPSGLSGFADHLNVAPQQTRGLKASEDYSQFTGTMTVVEVERMDVAIEAASRVPWP